MSSIFYTLKKYLGEIKKNKNIFNIDNLKNNNLSIIICIVFFVRFTFQKRINNVS
jgi:hypothetical protein